MVTSSAEKILSGSTQKNSERRNVVLNKYFLCLDYCGSITESFIENVRKLLNVNAVFTSTKARSQTSFLKCFVPKILRSNVVYEIMCPTCQGTYIGQTARHLLTRTKKHARASTPVGQHFTGCSASLTHDNVEILGTLSNNRHLLALEAVFIKRRNPSINTREEFRQHALNYAF